MLPVVSCVIILWNRPKQRKIVIFPLFNPFLHIIKKSLDNIRFGVILFD